MEINRKEFFKHYREHFGVIRQDLVDALDTLLTSVETGVQPSGGKGSSKTIRRQLAYCLATFKWETANTFKPIDEYGNSAYFEKRYGKDTRVGRMLGNTQPGDGALFHGRGFVQLTGRANYKKASDELGQDFLSSPDLAKDPKHAYDIAMLGMSEGWFTGKKLSDFFADDKAPYWVEARTIINGHDKAEKIAEIARHFSEILEVSIVA